MVVGRCKKYLLFFCGPANVLIYFLYIFNESYICPNTLVFVLMQFKCILIFVII